MAFLGSWAGYGGTCNHTVRLANGRAKVFKIGHPETRQGREVFGIERDSNQELYIVTQVGMLSVGLTGWAMV